MLVTHQQQLTHLTSLTGEIYKSLQALQAQASATAIAAASPPIASTSAEAAPPPPVLHPSASPRLAFPEKFDGTPGKCKGFLLQCSLFIEQQPALYPTDESRIAFVCSLLSGRALEWATAVWNYQRPVFPTFAAFVSRFKEVFQQSADGKEAGEQLMALKQGRGSAADYALTFRTLAAQSDWNEGPLKLHYRKGLNMELQAELACRDEGLSLEQYIDLSIRVDNLMRSRKPIRHTVSYSPAQAAASSEAEVEPMQVGFTRLTVEERERRMRNNLCLYCGQPGHLRATCPSRPPRRTSSWQP
ncbi:hypothetical protein Q8A67_025857 [Cirrhinus molitorella]|uniref:CCHC-type domain-containing protein n=1 Tax=Cirrhinus molitorella TaxID=172907 RepID=A0AA88NWV5_9TELE|nr:hypothetical protein Q8A67_025857 [Cirrhinus molitorella]